MPSEKQHIEAIQAQQPERSSVILKRPSMEPARLAVQARCRELYHQCHDEIDRLGKMYHSIKMDDRSTRRTKKMPKRIVSRIEKLVECANQADEVARAVMRKDAETGEWCLTQVPSLAAADLLRGQDVSTLEAMGKYHRLYMGKYRALYGRKL